MNKAFLLLITFSLFFSSKTNYWNLGLSINNQSKRVIRKNVKINDIAVEESNILKSFHSNTIYTLDKNYIIEPEKRTNNIEENIDQHSIEYFYNIKELIANDEYFEAAKKLILIDEENIELIFDGHNDYYYCSSIIYYNLGNMEEAYFNIEKIYDRENSPDLLFLEALILQSIDIKKSESLLGDIINHFPSDDYAEYAKDILKDSQ